MGRNRARKGGLDGRVRALESVRAPANDQHRRLMRMCCERIVHIRPGLALVEPQDTDADTYRSIQRTLAWARGDYELAEHLQRQQAAKRGKEPARTRRGRNSQPTPGPVAGKPHSTAGGGSLITPEFVERMNEMTSEVLARCEREREAIAKARARLGMPATDPGVDWGD